MPLGLHWQRDRGYGGKVRWRKLQRCHEDNIRIIPSLSLVCGQKLYHESTTMKRCFVENLESLRDWFTPTLGLCRCALVLNVSACVFNHLITRPDNTKTYWYIYKERGWKVHTRHRFVHTYLFCVITSVGESTDASAFQPTDKK